MVHEYDASVSEYLAEIVREDLIKICANEVLGLVGKNTPYRRERKKHVESLTRKELRKVRSYLAKEAKGLRKQGESIEGSLEAKVRWYDSREALYEKGVAYLDKML